MCNPALVVGGLQIASGVVQARSNIAEGNAQNAYYQYMAQQNENQAALTERTAQAQSRIIQDVTKEKGKALAGEGARLRASQKAALASSGVTGITAEDITKDTLNTQLLDELSLRYNADVQSYETLEGAKNNAYGLRSQATGFRGAGEMAKKAGRRNAFATLLGTAASVFNPFASSLFKPKPWSPARIENYVRGY